MGRAFEYRKERMFKRWGNMSRTFSKIGKEIAMAVKAGGPNPDVNAKLRACIQNAKASQMPKENVERAIKKASEKDQADYKEMAYEGYAPHGVALIIEAATDNTTRTVANVRSIFNKYGGSLGTSGSVDFMFDRKSFFKIANTNVNVEELELEAIDFGGDEIFVEGEEVVIYGGFQDYGTLQKFLEGKHYEIKSSGFERIPTTTVEVSPEAEAVVNKLIEKLEEDDDIQNVYHNMK